MTISNNLRAFSETFFKRPLKNHKSKIFCTPKFDDHVDFWYLLFRWLMFILWSTILVYSIFPIGADIADIKKRMPFWPIYLTNWTVCLGTLQSFFGAILVTRGWSVQKTSNKLERKLDRLDRSYWFLMNAATSLAMGVTITYWSAIYKPETVPVDALNVMQHVFNSILMMIDFLIVSVPFYFLDVWMCTIVPVIYVIFSVIYFLAGGHDSKGNRFIYTILDWQKPWKALLICVGVFSLLVMLHAFLCLTSLLINRLTGWQKNKPTDDIEFSDSQA